MKAIVLAAGRGERMRPLTDHTPKPLLPVHGKPLIEWHIEALARAGVREIVVNTAWLEERMVEGLGDGTRFGVSLVYSMEGRGYGGALETAGGIATALPLLAGGPSDGAGRDVFWVVSGDIHAPGFHFPTDAVRRFTASDALAHLWLVRNPPFHPRGDFGIDAQGRGIADAPGPDGRTWTYANLALFRASFFEGVAAGTRVALGPMLFNAMRARRVTCEVWRGAWENVGTPAQLAALNRTPAPVSQRPGDTP